ncbi:hypothetical protein AAMO2058_001679600 [Amorphochlora amoebiformis]
MSTSKDTKLGSESKTVGAESREESEKPTERQPTKQSRQNVSKHGHQKIWGLDARKLKAYRELSSDGVKLNDFTVDETGKVVSVDTDDEDLDIRPNDIVIEIDGKAVGSMSALEDGNPHRITILRRRPTGFTRKPSTPERRLPERIPLVSWNQQNWEQVTLGLESKDIKAEITSHEQHITHTLESIKHIVRKVHDIQPFCRLFIHFKALGIRVKSVVQSQFRKVIEAKSNQIDRMRVLNVFEAVHELLKEAENLCQSVNEALHMGASPVYKELYSPRSLFKRRGSLSFSWDNDKRKEKKRFLEIEFQLYQKISELRQKGKDDFVFGSLDMESTRFWCRFFGMENAVDILTFAEALRMHLRHEHGQEIPKKILEQMVTSLVDVGKISNRNLMGHDGYIQWAEFQEFISRYGPLRQCYMKMQGVCVPRRNESVGEDTQYGHMEYIIELPNWFEILNRAGMDEQFRESKDLGFKVRQGTLARDMAFVLSFKDLTTNEVCHVPVLHDGVSGRGNVEYLIEQAQGNLKPLIKAPSVRELVKKLANMGLASKSLTPIASKYYKSVVKMIEDENRMWKNYAEWYHRRQQNADPEARGFATVKELRNFPLFRDILGPEIKTRITNYITKKSIEIGEYLTSLRVENSPNTQLKSRFEKFLKLAEEEASLFHLFIKPTGVKMPRGFESFVAAARPSNNAPLERPWNLWIIKEYQRAGDTFLHEIVSAALTWIGDIDNDFKQYQERFKELGRLIDRVAKIGIPFHHTDSMGKTPVERLAAHLLDWQISPEHRTKVIQIYQSLLKKVFLHTLRDMGVERLHRCNQQAVNEVKSRVAKFKCPLYLDEERMENEVKSRVAKFKCPLYLDEERMENHFQELFRNVFNIVVSRGDVGMVEFFLNQGLLLHIFRAGEERMFLHYLIEKTAHAALSERDLDPYGIEIKPAFDALSGAPRIAETVFQELDKNKKNTPDDEESPENVKFELFMARSPQTHDTPLLAAARKHCLPMLSFLLKVVCTLKANKSGNNNAKRVVSKAQASNLLSPAPSDYFNGFQNGSERDASVSNKKSKPTPIGKLQASSGPKQGTNLDCKHDLNQNQTSALKIKPIKDKNTTPQEPEKNAVETYPTHLKPTHLAPGIHHTPFTIDLNGTDGLTISAMQDKMGNTLLHLLIDTWRGPNDRERMKVEKIDRDSWQEVLEDYSTARTTPTTIILEMSDILDYLRLHDEPIGLMIDHKNHDKRTPLHLFLLWYLGEKCVLSNLEKELMNVETQIRKEISTEIMQNRVSSIRQLILHQNEKLFEIGDACIYLLSHGARTMNLVDQKDQPDSNLMQALLEICDLAMGRVDNYCWTIPKFAVQYGDHKLLQALFAKLKTSENFPFLKHPRHMGRKERLRNTPEKLDKINEKAIRIYNGIGRFSEPFGSLPCHTLLHVAATSPFSTVDIVNEIDEQDRMIEEHEGLHRGITGQDWRLMVTSEHIRRHSLGIIDEGNQPPIVLVKTRGRESPNILRASLDLTDELEKNPLHYIASHTSNRATAIAKKMIEMQGAIDKRDILGMTPLHIAVKADQFQIVQHMLGNQKIVDIKVQIPKKKAKVEDILEMNESIINIAQILKSKDFRPFYKYSPQYWKLDHCAPLFFAAEQGNWRIVTSLVEHKAKIDIYDIYGRTPLTVAFQVSKHRKLAIRSCQEMILRIDDWNTNLENKIQNLTNDCAAEEKTKEVIKDIQEQVKKWSKEQEWTDEEYNFEDPECRIRKALALFQKIREPFRLKTRKEGAGVTQMLRRARRLLKLELRFLRKLVPQYTLTIEILLRQPKSTIAKAFRLVRMRVKDCLDLDRDYRQIRQRFRRIKFDIATARHRHEAPAHAHQEGFKNPLKEWDRQSDRFQKAFLVTREKEDRRFEIFRSPLNREITYRKFKQIKWKAVKGYMLMYLMYVVLLTSVAIYTSGRFNASAITYIQGARSVLVEDEFPARVSPLLRTFENIDNVDEFFKWAKGPYLDVFYPDTLPQFYQDGDLQFRDNVFLIRSTLLGNPRWRQQRHQTEDCRLFDSNSDLADFCVEKSSSIKWVPRQKHGSSEAFADFTFSDPPGILSYKWAPGTSSWYSGAGFNVDFPPTGSINTTFSNITDSITQRAAALALIGTLQNATWVDTLTKAVFVEFNAYNPTEDLLMIGTLFVEFPTSGGVVTSSNFDVLTDVTFLSRRSAWAWVVKIICFGVFVGRLSSYVASMYVKLTTSGGCWHHGVFAFYFALDTAINIVWIFVIVAQFYLYGRARDTNFNSEGYIDLSERSFMSSIYLNFLSLLVFLLWIRLTELLAIRLNFTHLVIMVGHMLSKISKLLFFMVILWIAFAMGAFIAYGYRDEARKNPTLSFFNAFSASFNAPEPGLDNEQSVFLGTVYDFLLVVMVLLVLVNLIIAIMNTAYEEARMKAKAYWARQMYRLIEEHNMFVAPYKTREERAADEMKEWDRERLEISNGATTERKRTESECPDSPNTKFDFISPESKWNPIKTIEDENGEIRDVRCQLTFMLAIKWGELKVYEFFDLAGEVLRFLLFSPIFLLTCGHSYAQKLR